MKKKLLFIAATAVMLSIPKITLGQAPSLGSASNYVLFTSGGAVGNTGVTRITGNIGTQVGAITSFGNIDGVVNAANAATTLCATDLATAYAQLNATPATTNHAAVFGGGETLVAGVYSVAAAGSAATTLSLDAQGNGNAVFIFKIGGAFTTGAATKVYLINGAQACNVFWKVEGAVSLGAGTIMKGTVIANGAAVSIAAGCKVEGRMFSTAGAIAIDGSVAYLPLGCGSPTLTGPAAPALGITECFALFSSIGAVTNSVVSTITGDVGTNVGLTSGFTASNVIGTIHPAPDAFTGSCATDLMLVYNSLNVLTPDIELLYPAQLGNKLVLTPHTYTLNAATMLTDTLFLNAQNNANAVFVISINGALTTSTDAKVILTNGAQAKNVFWLVKGSTSINTNSNFIGTIVCFNGNIDLSTGVDLNGRALTTSGALTTNSVTVVKPSNCNPTGINSLTANKNAVINIYPNPFNTSVNINLNNLSPAENIKLEIYNVAGELIMSTTLTEQLSNIETADLATGFYFYKVISNHKTIQSGKLISQK
jgi:hypothetical protein